METLLIKPTISTHYGSYIITEIIIGYQFSFNVDHITGTVDYKKEPITIEIGEMYLN